MRRSPTAACPQILETATARGTDAVPFALFPEAVHCGSLSGWDYFMLCVWGHRHALAESVLPESPEDTWRKATEGQCLEQGPLAPFKPKGYHPRNSQLKCCKEVENQKKNKLFNRPGGCKHRQLLRVTAGTERGGMGAGRGEGARNCHRSAT